MGVLVAAGEERSVTPPLTMASRGTAALAGEAPRCHSVVCFSALTQRDLSH